MPFTSAGLNYAADAVAGAADYVSLHTGDPSTGGTNEVTGGSPAYARKAATWAAAAAGDTTASQLTFDVPAGATVSHWGLWTAATGGTFLGGFSLTTSESFAGQGQYKLTPTIDFD